MHVLQRVEQFVALAAKECLRFGIIRIEDSDRRAGLAVKGNVEIADHDIGIIEIGEDVIQCARLVRCHVDGNDAVEAALVSCVLQRFL